jgi:multiple sugar transport system permease protein
MDHAAYFDGHVPVFHRDDPPAGRALMAAVVGSRRKRRLQAGLVYASLIALAAAFLFPLFWVLGLSFKTRLQVFADPPLFIWWPTFENYIDVLGRSDFLLAFVNTLVVASSAVTLSLCVGVPAA